MEFECKSYGNGLAVKNLNLNVFVFNKIALSLLMCTSIVSFPLTSSASPVTAPRTITSNDAEEVWGAGDPITINNSNGIFINGGKLTLNEVSTEILNTRNGGYGLFVNNNGKLTINGGTYNHSAASNSSPALRAQAGGELIVDNLTITHKAVDDGDYMLSVDEGGIAKITNSNFTVNESYMMQATGDGVINISNSRLHLLGNRSDGEDVYYSIQTHPDGRIIGDRLTVISDVNADLNNGVIFLGNGNIQLTNSLIQSNKGQTIFSDNVTGDNLILNYVSNTADGAKGRYATTVTYDSVLKLSNSTLNVSGDHAYLGAHVYGGATLLGNNLTINAKDNVQAIQISDETSLVDLTNSVINNEKDTQTSIRVFRSGQVNLKDSQINANGIAIDSINGQAIVNASGSQTLIEGKNGALKVVARNMDTGFEMNLSDSASMVGDMSTSQVDDYVATLNLNLSQGAHWQGASVNTTNDIKNGVINIAIDNASWTMNSDSSIDSLSLLNNGEVTLFNAQNSHPQRNVLTVENLSGQGSFKLRTDIVGDGSGNNSGDLLRVTGTTEGSHTLTVMNNGSAATDGTETLTVVETADGNGQFSLNSKVELGGYEYDLRKIETHWQLFGAPATSQIEMPQPPPEPRITSTADASANFLNIGYLMNYAETQTLLQRMGDLRQNGERGDMWLRGFAGKFDSFSGGKLSQFDMSYSGMQIGADKRISPEVPLFVGVFMGQTQGSPDYRSGDGTTKSSNAGIYGSYMAANGFYTDAVAKYSHVKNNFSVRDSQDNRVRGNGNSDGVSLSLEAGQKFNLTEQNRGFYVEPQLQLTYGHQDAAQIKASNGLKVDLGSYESLMGRASALLGYELNQGDNKVNVYLKTGLVREFEGDVDYQLNGSTESHTFKGNWWNNGIGVSAQVGKQHTLYLDLDSSTGNKFDQRQINGGYRFSF
ncbi:P.93 [Budvicia aquatica]|uniref:Autotransporter outer membrane beta-barrel domain-containing protein n=1 Tax=Budvicia aquatica TaxID=82979 RepID=A0A2C6DFZ1_9GAMM|nr:autotransporter outer membrane beta-barrel domain-containing protein [Budvicia aquatica]VFS45922.1 P.93 [Budvicia aquatica]